MCKGSSIKLKGDFSSETMESKRQQHNICIPEGKKLSVKNFIFSKMITMNMKKIRKKGKNLEFLDQKITESSLL